MADIQADRNAAKQQEALLVFAEFSEAVAWRLGNQMRAAAESRALPVLIDISQGEHSVFRTALPGSGPANGDWARRKRNLVNLLQECSYAVGLSDFDYVTEMGLELRDYAPHGGCFPIRVRHAGMVGTVTVSGLPQREDHKFVVEQLALFLGVDLGPARMD